MLPQYIEPVEDARLGLRPQVLEAVLEVGFGRTFELLDGFLVIGLTFLIFFLIQSISKIAIHIFQYAMIGLALIMFYTLLISVTEHSSFKLAYLIAGISVVVMIALYSISILKDRKFPLFIGASLAALYAFIYVIIQLENYALLAGSIGLFFILGAVMYFSRKINWSSSPA